MAEFVTAKTISDYKNELLSLGLVVNERRFTFPDMLAPVSINLADDKFVRKVGRNPRIAFPKSAVEDQTLRLALKNLGLVGKRSLGITLVGWDFCDKRSSQELYDQMFDIENEYRRLI